MISKRTGGAVYDFRRAALILACSIPADAQHVFKDEYILPQCVFQAIIEKHYNNDEYFNEDYIFGIRCTLLKGA